MTRPFLSIIALAVVVLMAGGCGKPTPGGKVLYTCGMHPQVIQDHPGNCPICGMKLTPVRKQPGVKSPTPVASQGERKIKSYKSTMMPGEVSQTPGKDSMGMEMVPVYEDATGMESSTISIDPITVQNMGIRTGVVTRGPLRRVIRTVGAVDYNETAQADVTTKFKGWIEKLEADAVGKQVRKGEPLFEIYSPELWSAQSEYLLALKQPVNAGLKSSALRKLKYFDVSEDQIAQIAKLDKPRKTLTVEAPMDGIIVEKMAVEGQMVEAGQKLYRLADLSLVWVQSQIYEQDLPYLKLGQEAMVSLSYMPESKFRGRVTYIYPFVDEKTRTARIRMEFHNPGLFLKPGMFVTVELQAELSPSTLLVPDSAVLRSGEKNTVFVALEGGRFEPRVVVLGPRAENNMYQVLSGLQEGDRVVMSGQFMLDSESQLREAIQKMQNPSTEGPQPEKNEPAPARGAASPSPSPSPTPTPEETAYACPMPEHETILHKAPGKCPICGMTLIPVPMPAATTTPPPQPESPPATILYTCPMPQHAHVVSDKPGECPECGMDLVETSKVKHGKEAEKNWQTQHSPPTGTLPQPLH